MPRHVANLASLRNWCAVALAVSVLGQYQQRPVLAADPNSSGLELFEKKIRPALIEKCYQCHSARAKSVKGGLLLDTSDALRKGGESGPAVVAGQVDKSLLIQAIRYGEDSYQMPPSGKLPAALIADFEKWIALGAPDPRGGASQPKTAARADVQSAKQFWSFQQPLFVPPPEINNQAWPRTDIDRFILARLERRNLQPVSDAERHVLLRRVTFDLTGLPPTREQMTSFLADRSPQAFERLVDQLLASPDFGERWGRHWLDVARYADSNGNGINMSFDTAWRYRDYVIDSLNNDKPFDQFVREQIAGDLLPAENPRQAVEQTVATAFLVLGPKEIAAYDKPKLQMDVIDEQIDTVGRSLLGLTLGCARCHDHKFDPIPTVDYYALAGIFRSTQTLRGNVGDNMLYTGWMMRPLSLPLDAAHARALEEHKKADKAGRMNLRAVEKELRELQKELLAASDPQKNKDLQAKIDDAKKRVNKMKDAWQAVKENTPEPPPEVMAVADEPQPHNAMVLIRGQMNSVGPEVPRGFIRAALAGEQPPISPKQSGRRELANWLASPNNPLTARVMVNRIWCHLMGEGLVRTVDNFGLRGEKPSHPELLDYLAIRFVNQGWSVKQMIRQIVLTRVYQLSSAPDEKARAVDAENRLLWRHNRHRLDGDAIRDGMLAISGQLDRARGGETLPYTGMLFSGEAGGYWHKLNRVRPPWKRRSVYLPILRDGHVSEVELLEVLDFPDPNMVTGQRATTNVPTQALYMMNSPFVMDQARGLAESLLHDTTLDDAGRVMQAYARTLARDATPHDITDSLEYFKKFSDVLASESKQASADSRLQSWSSFCQVLLTSNEFLFLE